MKKTLATLALAGILTFSAGTVAAQAAPEYPAAPGATVSDTTVAPGQAVTFAGAGFTAGEIIDVTVTQTSTVAGGAIGSIGGGISMSKPLIIKAVAPASFTTTAAADGSFSVPVTLDQKGTYTLTATGRTSGVSASQVVKVDASFAAGAGTGTGTGNNVAGAGSGVTDGGLASTGLDAGVLVWSIVGAGALAAGVGTVVVSRRRSRNA
ncbi:LPXTG cell wall anchor domain-containing protein [Arthrobacter psychrolactophilus]